MVPFPVMLDLRGRRCLVVGGDDDAVSRAEKLVQAGAAVRVLLRPESEEAERLCTLAEGRGVHIERRSALPEDIDGAALAIVATSEEAQAPPLYARAVETGRLLCTVDRPELSTFIHPAVVRAGPLAVAVSTGGASPALARRIREDLEALFSEPRFVAWASAVAGERAALPRGERAARGAEAVRGFSIEARLVLPDALPDAAKR